MSDFHSSEHLLLNWYFVTIISDFQNNKKFLAILCIVWQLNTVTECKIKWRVVVEIGGGAASENFQPYQQFMVDNYSSNMISVRFLFSLTMSAMTATAITVLNYRKNSLGIVESQKIHAELNHSYFLVFVLNQDGSVIKW